LLPTKRFSVIVTVTFPLQYSKNKAFCERPFALHRQQCIRSMVRKYSGPPELLRSEISFSHTCSIPKQWKSTQTRSYLDETLFCSYFDKIVYLLYNSQSL